MKNIVIGTSALLITFRCNLNCKLCCTNTPYREKSQRIDFPLDELKAVVTKYYTVVSFIRKFSLGGGEPTIHKSLPELIEYIMKFKEQFEVLEIITNGAAIPHENVISVLAKFKDKVFITIDNYGPDVSRNAFATVDVLNKHEIKNQVRNYNAEEAHFGGWVDLGDFSRKHNSTPASKFLSCCISNKKKNNTATLGEYESDDDNIFFINYAANTRGKIHRCARAYSTFEAGAVKDVPENFVNTLDKNKSIEQIREEIIAMWSTDYYEPCEYCNGFDDSSIRYIPAEQL